MEDSDPQRPSEPGRASRRGDGSSWTDTARLGAVRAYLSGTQLRRIARGGDRTAMDRGWGALLTFDVSGFSELAERHAREGARGIEVLSGAVHDFFGTITEHVLANGGDVLYHAGDAVSALFPAETEADRDRAVQRAVRAAIDAHGRLEASARNELEIRAAVGCGETLTWEVGGLDDAWILIVQGEAVREAASVDQAATPGAVSVSEAVWRRLGSVRQGSRAEGGVYRVTGLAPVAAPPSDAIELGPEHLPAIVASLSPAVRSRFDARALTLPAEFRPVSIFVVSVPDIDVEDVTSRGRLQEAVLTAQSELVRLGNPQLEVLGDKGLGFIGMFGLPPQAHDDDAVRAIDAALALRGIFGARGMRAAIGVATGVVWAGPAGSEGRHSYDVVGSVSVRAARLMQVAGDDVLVCAQTRRLAAKTVELVDLPPVHLKGFPGAQAVFRPVGRRTKRARAATRLAGRGAELGRLVSHLTALLAGAGGSVILEAEPGMGKSVMLQAAREIAEAKGVVIFDGGADSIEAATPYFAVRGAVLDLLGAPRGAAPALIRECALARIEADAAELAWLAPLLDAIVPLDLPDSHETAQILGTTRAERLGDLLVALVRAAVARGPVIWSIEDLHWADRASWSLCKRLVEEVPGLLLLATSRPMAVAPPERETLTVGEKGASSSGREVIVLDDLPEQALGEIVAMRLGVSELPGDLVALLAARADGNPFFAEEIALAAREAGGLVVEGGRVRIARPLAALDLPTSITGVITSRIDRLEDVERGALRCAAVLGPTFDVRTLGALLGGMPEDEVTELAQRLAESTFVDPDVDERLGDVWRFRHAFLREAAYALLPFAERRALHATAAEAIEAAPDTDLDSVAALLAHHYEIAERAERAAHYYGLAGKQALEADANQECVEHLTKALRFDELARGPRAVDLQRARWARMLTEASYSLSRHDDAKTWGDRTFRWCGLRTPTHAGHVTLDLGRHVWGRWIPTPQADEDTRARYAEACQVSSTLQAVATWGGDQVGQLALAVYADVVSRACDPSPARVFAQSSMGFILVIVGMRDVGVRDMLAAAAMADALGDAPSQIAAKVLLGLGLSSLGRNHDALPPLAHARELAERVGSGLWRHRALFQSGEPYYQLGQLTTAEELFARCVTVARKVEPPAAGMATAMRALCRLRAGGAPDEALALLEGPHGLTIAEPGPTMMALVALGVHAWALLLAGRHDEALVSARKCVTLLDTKGDDAIAFARAMDGHAHAAVTLARLSELRREGAPGTASLPSADELAKDAARAAAGLARVAGRWPAAEPLSLLLEAHLLRLRGKKAPSLRALERAVESAERVSHVWERSVALSAMERHHGRASAELAGLVRDHGLGGVTAGYFPI